ncbi:MAG: methylmalonyl-CoA mutase, partial [Alphaproteobacteria bacterium]|nr:methylmalonyl-CoA mutase [Alphaproteobacteria bacterium]
YVESLTAELIERAWAFFEEIQARGGFLATLNSGWLHNCAHENQHEDFLAQERRERIIVGVNEFKADITPFEVDGFVGVSDAFEVAMQRLKDVRTTRAQKPAADALRNLERVCRSDENIMPAMMDALDAEVTLGEVGDVWRNVFGDWVAPQITV